MVVDGGVSVCRFSIDADVKCVVFSSYEEVLEADCVVFLCGCECEVWVY